MRPSLELLPSTVRIWKGLESFWVVSRCRQTNIQLMKEPPAPESMIVVVVMIFVDLVPKRVIRTRNSFDFPTVEVTSIGTEVADITAGFFIKNPSLRLLPLLLLLCCLLISFIIRCFASYLLSLARLFGIASLLWVEGSIVGHMAVLTASKAKALLAVLITFLSSNLLVVNVHSIWIMLVLVPQFL